MSNELISYQDIEKMAAAVAKSKLFGVQSPEQAVALMLLAQAEGLHPMVAARDFDIIQGRPAMKSRAMLARFQQSGGKIEWIERSDEAAEAEFSHPQSPTPVRVRWDMKRAAAAGLAGKDNWKKFTRQMLSARTVSEGVTACFPAATNGLYTPEEARDFEPVKIKDMGAASIVSDGIESLKDKLRKKVEPETVAPIEEAVPPEPEEPADHASQPIEIATFRTYMQACTNMAEWAEVASMGNQLPPDDQAEGRKIAAEHKKRLQVQEAKAAVEK